MKPAYICGHDSEDGGKGDPFLWCFTHAEGSWYTRSQTDAREYIAKLSSTRKAKGQQLQVWATNLEYDLCNLFDLTSIREVSLRFGRSALCGARWNGTDFRDTLRHLSSSVESLGEMVGIHKLGATLFDSGNSRKHIPFAAYLERCQRDATITYRAATMFKQAYEELGERGRMTLASTALNLWKNQHWKREVQRPAQSVWEAALEAYHGGRTQAFSVGTFDNVSVLDVASMFPWAMTCKPLPLPWGMFRAVKRGSKLCPFGIFRCSIRHTSKLPLLPVRTKNGTIYPTGEWEGWYVGEEALAAVEAGAKISVIEGFEFGESCEPFGSYVETLFALKQRAKGGRREMYKLLLNSLYG